MKIDAKDVDTYLTKVPVERRERLTELRALCLEVLEGYTEDLRYGMPSYRHADQEPEVAFASQKNYISLYILKQEVLDRFRVRLKQPGVSMGKGCVRYSKPEKIDLAIVREMLEESKRSDSDIC